MLVVGSRFAFDDGGKPGLLVSRQLPGLDGDPLQMLVNADDGIPNAL